MKTNFENLEIFKLSERLADNIWNLVIRWDAFSKKTIGSQLVNAADGVGSNIAEGSGKGSYLDFRRYIKIARGSLYETKYWLRRAYERKLISDDESIGLNPMLDELLPRLNAFKNYLDKQIRNNKILD